MAEDKEENKKKNKGGRPHSRDREKIARDMIEWAKRDESINLCEFCTMFVDPPIAPQTLVRYTKEQDWFCEAYDITKAILGARRERMLNKQELHVKAYDLNAATYDFFLKQEKRQQAEFEADLKKKEDDQMVVSLSELKDLISAGKLKQE